MNSEMVSTLVAASILILASTIKATYSIGPWSPAQATYYGADDGSDGNMGGACGYGDTNGVISSQYFGLHTAALSDVLFQNGERCGACFELQCMNAGKGINWCLQWTVSVVVTATNNCPLGSFGGGGNSHKQLPIGKLWRVVCDAPREHFDLSVPAFTSIAQKAGGVVPIQYRRVPCQKQGGIRFFLKGNPFFQTVMIYNVAGAGDIQSVSIKGDNTPWIPTKRNWGEKWQFGGSLNGQALSFSVTTFDNATITSNNVADSSWAYGMTYKGSQFF